MTDEQWPTDKEAQAPTTEQELLKIFQEKGGETKLVLQEIWQDEEARVALVAAGRLLINLGISLADFIPGFGDVFSWGADLLKWTRLDLSPDVSKKIAVGSELSEVLGGAVPSHFIETFIQLGYDIPRMKKGLKRAQEIWTAHQKAINSPEVQDAAAVFASEEIALPIQERSN